MDDTNQITVEDHTAAPPRSKKTLQPLGDCVVFRSIDADQTPGGLFIPVKGASAEARKKAIVVAVGPGKLLEDGTRVPVSVKPGDQVVAWVTAPEIGNVDFTYERLYMIHESDIAAVVVDLPDEP